MRNKNKRILKKKIGIYMSSSLFSALFEIIFLQFKTLLIALIITRAYEISKNKYFIEFFFCGFRRFLANMRWCAPTQINHIKRTGHVRAQRFFFYILAYILMSVFKSNKYIHWKCSHKRKFAKKYRCFIRWVF